MMVVFMPSRDPRHKGWRKKPCPFDPEGLHRWTTMEGRDAAGREHKWTACSKCMMQP